MHKHVHQSSEMGKGTWGSLFPSSSLHILADLVSLLMGDGEWSNQMFIPADA